MSAPFQFDDAVIFTDPALGSTSGWWQVWSWNQTRPLTYFTFWVNWFFGGHDPFLFHGTNLVLHVATVVMLWLVLRRIVPERAAIIATAVFAVHPIQTEPVAYVFARAIVIATLLCLVSLWEWLRGRRWMAVLWFAAALLAKEECVAFPLMLILYNLSVTRDGRDWKPILAMVGLSVAAGFRVLLATRGVEGAGFGASVTPIDYFLAQGIAIWRYFALLIVPYGFTVDFAMPSVDFWLRLAAWVGLGFVVVASMWRFERAGEGFWFLAGFVLLLPSSSVFPADDLAVDRRMYLPLVAFAPLAGILLAKIRPRLLIGGLLALMVLSVLRTEVWRSERALWAEAASRAPHKLRPKLRLARVLPPNEALGLLEEATKVAPEDPRVAAEIGRVHLEMSDAAGALGYFGRALALAPGNADTLSNRGLALLMLNQRDAAETDFLSALAVDPCHFGARLNLRQMGTALIPRPGCRYTEDQRAALQSAAAR